MPASLKRDAGKFVLLAGFAGAAVHHGFDGAGVLFLGGVGFAAGGGGHASADLLFDVDGGLFDV